MCCEPYLCIFVTPCHNCRYDTPPSLLQILTTISTEYFDLYTVSTTVSTIDISKHTPIYLYISNAISTKGRYKTWVI